MRRRKRSLTVGEEGADCTRLVEEDPVFVRLQELNGRERIGPEAADSRREREDFIVKASSGCVEDGVWGAML